MTGRLLDVSAQASAGVNRMASKPQPTPTPKEDPMQKGDCHVGGKVLHGKTRQECESMNGKWVADKPGAKPTASPAKPSSGQP